jgi:hypothetical protein
MPIKNKRRQFPNFDTATPVINQTQTTKINSQQSQTEPERDPSAESKTHSATPQSGTSSTAYPANPNDPVLQHNPQSKENSDETKNNSLQKANSPIVPSDYKSQPEPEKEKGATKSLRKKQADDDFASQFQKLQKDLINLVNCLRRTYPSKTAWAEDYSINSMEQVLAKIFRNEPLSSSVTVMSEVDLHRLSLEIEIQKTRSKLLELCKDQLKKEGVNEIKFYGKPITSGD